MVYFIFPQNIGLDSFFEVIEGLIAFFIAFYSYKIYKFTKQRSYFFLSGSFFLITCSFFVIAITNYFSFAEWTSAVSPWVKITTINTVYSLGYLFHVLLMTSAIVSLVILGANIKDEKLVVLFYLIALSAVTLSVNIYLSYHFIQLLLLAYILPYFYKNYKKKKSNNSLLVFLAFSLFFFSHISFLFAHQNASLYFLGHFIQLTSFLVLLISLIKIFFKK